jgi:hypothetical protein
VSHRLLRAALCVVFSWLAVQAPAAIAAESTVALWWRTPTAPEVAWRGMLATEGGNVGAGPFIGLYPAVGPAGLLIAVLTHGAIAQGAQSAQRKREQEAADKVLDNYPAALRTWPSISLWEAAAGGRERLWDGSAATPDTVVEMMPVFSLAQDEDAVFLDVTVRISSGMGAAPKIVEVRVLSSPLKTTAARAHWSADDASALKATAAAMLAHAVRLASQHEKPAGNTTSTNSTDNVAEAAPARTHRYLQGSMERTERAQQLAGDCSRVVLRTLRGGLLSVPVRPTTNAECTIAAAF